MTRGRDDRRYAVTFSGTGAAIGADVGCAPHIPDRFEADRTT